MKKNFMELLEELSQSLMFTLSKSEYETLLKEFPTILKQMELVKRIDVKDYEPMHFPFTTTHHQLRDDDVFQTINSELILENAPKHQLGYIVINKVIN